MSYIPHVWQDEEVITRQNMNHIESGIAAAITEIEIIDAETIDAIFEDEDE